MSAIINEEILPYNIISRGPLAGSYQAFPDACRLHNGDILVAFYAGYDHISYPNDEYPTGGKICMARSSDEGQTWSEPEILYDDELDNRDPHLAQLSDGTLICSFFSLWRKDDEENGYASSNAQIIRSEDDGHTWGPQPEFIETDGENWVCSAPVRQLADGTCLLPMYHHYRGGAWGGVVRSDDLGATWSRETSIAEGSGLFLPAETDIIQLKDGTLYAALRADQEVGVHMHYATSADLGLMWSEAQDIGFFGHAPHFTRLSNGLILLSTRGFRQSGDVAGYTALQISDDEAQTWHGPITIDSSPGAYTSTVELRDGSILIVYYEEGEGSGIRASRFYIGDDWQLIPA